MADDSNQQRTLPASERKIQKAREQGQVPRSMDLGHLLMLACGLALLGFGAQSLWTHLQSLLHAALQFNAQGLSHADVMQRSLWQLGRGFLAIFVPMGVAFIVAAILSQWLMGGWNFSLKALELRWHFLHPVSAVQRLFSGHSLINTAKTSLLALILGAVGGVYVYQKKEAFQALWHMALIQALQEGAQLCFMGLLTLLLVVFFFALLDVPLQKHLYAQNLKMSRQEQKEEQKETEGSSENKSRIKSRMREMAKRRMLAAIPSADVVILNPTHYAVALRYDEATMKAPRVVAKGADLLALTIRDLAKASNVTLIQAPVLARALYAHTALDAEIPAPLFAAVAQVLAYVYQLKAAVDGLMPQPTELPPLPVPPELDPHYKPASNGSAA